MPNTNLSSSGCAPTASPRRRAGCTCEARGKRRRVSTAAAALVRGARANPTAARLHPAAGRSHPGTLPVLVAAGEAAPRRTDPWHAAVRPARETPSGKARSARPRSPPEPLITTSAPAQHDPAPQAPPGAVACPLGRLPTRPGYSGQQIRGSWRADTAVDCCWWRICASGHSGQLSAASSLLAVPSEKMTTEFIFGELTVLCQMLCHLPRRNVKTALCL